MEFKSALKLYCPAKVSNWGKKAEESIIAKFSPQSKNDDLLAEFWMGTHPSNPALVEVGGQKITLNDLIKQEPREILGENISTKFNNELPFLFKILSINTALSIQAHPNKMLAAELRKKNPTQYPDSNHKPEMGIALTEVELLYGFAKYEKIKNSLELVEEFRNLLSEQTLEKVKIGSNDYLKSVLTDVMRADKDIIKVESQKLYQRLSQKNNLSPQERWILKLSGDFPEGDVGIFGFYILDFYKLMPDEAVFIGPNIAHAYLSGDVIECMACSDNVVRAGLTPKFQDVDTLLQMLDYKVDSLTIIKPESHSGLSTYKTPATEFAISKLDFSAKQVVLNQEQLPAILLCLGGEAEIVVNSNLQSIKEGEVYFFPHSLNQVKINSDSAEIFIANVPN
ncbi:MAG: mannose-6-phosphate isomerase, class I [Proteobacteria bacterium]|nr:mannose-6-phosphate isomerase, class I [Pseudomonadota bacterium]